MKRLLFLLPDVRSCKRIVAELEQAGISPRHLHVIGGIQHSLEGLPEASLWHRTELARGLEWGVSLGGVAGLLGGLLAVSFPPAGVIVGGGALLAGAAAGAGFGGLVAALTKGNEHNHQLDEYRSALIQGYLLVIIELHSAQLPVVRQLLLQHLPDTSIQVDIPNALPQNP